VVLVITGLVLGWAYVFQGPVLNKELLFSSFLPGLVFEAAFHIEFRQFWRYRRKSDGLESGSRSRQFENLFRVPGSALPPLTGTACIRWRRAFISATVEEYLERAARLCSSWGSFSWS
jgi:hypothetical protein